jgi:hypothetical protein
MMFLLLVAFSFAADLPGEEVFVAPKVVEGKSVSSPVKTLNKARGLVVKPQVTKSNLPSEYLSSFGRQSTASELVVPVKGLVEVFRGIKVGDNFDLYVDHSVIAFPDEKAPVVAQAQLGSVRGLKFIGESYLEPNSRRIFIDFNRVVQGDRIFTIKGVGVASNGQPGLSGEYHSREVEYFTGDFIASFAAGYFDGLVPRKTNVFEQVVEDHSVDTAVKKGLSSGALSTADRFREKLKKVPEFSEIRGPFNLKILILDQAKSIN